MRSRAGMWAAALAVAGALGTGGVAHADTWTVNNYADPSGGTCPDACSLRHAVAQSGKGDTIHIPAQNGLPVSLSQGGPIVVSHDLTITGDGMDATTIDGSANVDGKQNPHRIFTVQAPLQLSDVTLHGGDSAGDDTCPSACSTLGLNGGGAIFNTSTLGLDHVRFTGNRAAVGGAVSNSGTLDMADVEFAGGSAAFGGGLFVRGTATAQRASFHDLGDGGFGGGAIFVYRGSLALSDSTVATSGWASSLGGGIENSGGALTLTRDTLAGNIRGAIMTDGGGRTEVGGTIIGAGFDDNGDWACTPSGLKTNADTTTGPAITQDDGDNLDEDGHCGLKATGDRSGDAHLAPLADNGGATPTMALLHGSPALDAFFCQGVVDQRGITRPQLDLCDIGAFEAERTRDTPSVTTQDATAIGPYSARLNASVDLAGESGGAHFEWGTSGDQVATGHGASTAVAATGRTSTATLTLDGLRPDRTYYYRAVADNATAASTPGKTLSFTTAPGPPDVTDLTVDTVTDTSAKVSFTIDPNGADTSYVVKWGTDAPTESTDPVDLGVTPGPQALSVTLDKLQPDTTYFVEVVATSSEAPDGVSSETRLDTERQLSGHPGGLVTVQDSGDGCPTATVDWGDGSPAESGAIECVDGGEFGQTYFLRADHEYAQAGHYPVAIDYGRDGSLHEWALIAGSDQHVLRVKVSGPGQVSGTGIDCPSLCTTSADAGTREDLTASPGGGAVFLGWSGDCTGTDPDACSVTLDADRAVTARFAAPPVVSESPGADPVTDTTAQVHFSIDPNGADTSYTVEYGTDDTYGQTYGPVAVPAAGGPQDLSATLTGLRPGATYHFYVVATNAQGSAAGDDDTFATEPQVAGVIGRQVSISDVIPVDVGCPSATIDWGDQSTSDTEVSCVGGTGTLTADHTYAKADHYPIEIAYSDGRSSEQWALISAPQQATPTPTPTPTATASPSPTPTATPTPTPTPVFHQQVVVRPVSGTVLVRRKGSNTFVPLDAKAGVPLGSQVDVTHGRIQLTSVPRRGGKPQSAQFYAGIFTVTQPGSITQLMLSGPKPTCPRARGAASAVAARKKVRSRKLWGNGHGSFRTSGQYSAATVRGTQWLVQDTCAGTLTRVAHGLVAVTDRVRHKTILVRGGKSYLARPRR